MSLQALHIGGDDQRVLRSLAHLQQSFEPSLKTGGEALISFHQSLDAMLADCSSAPLQPATHVKVSSFVSMVRTISTALLDLEEKSLAIQAAFSMEITRLAEVDFKRLSIHDSPLPPATPDSPSFIYIEPCYKWLLDHLHNPYPSRKLREQISADTGTPVKHIDAWFIDVRKRIGWNRIRRAYFETRAEMVKAATRHFKPHVRTVRPSQYGQSTSDELDSNDYGAEFVAMQADAQALYAHKLFPTTFISDLDTKFEKRKPRGRDAVASYPSPESTPSRQELSPAPATNTVSRLLKRRNSDISSEDETTSEVSRQRPLKRSRISSLPYNHGGPSAMLPSPAESVFRKLSSSLSPSIALSPLPEITAPPQQSKRKRRLSNASEYDSDCSRAPRARRRRRVEEDGCDAQLPCIIVNPKQQLRGSESIHALPSKSALPDSSLSQSQTLKRKRRLSDTHSEQPRKLPHHAALMVPRLHTVSNPLPMTSLFSDIEDIPTSLSAELPPLANAVDFDDLRNLDVEAFDYGSIPVLKDYLSQLDSASIDDSCPLNPSSFVALDTYPSSQLQGSTSGTGLHPLVDLNLDFTAPNQLSLPSYDGLFSDIHTTAHTIAPEIMQNISSTADKLSTTLDQTFDTTFHHNTSSLLVQSSGVNPFDLMLYPSTNIPPTDRAHAVMTADHLSLSSGSAFVNGEASQAAFALQRIQALQAELDMCRNQLTQSGIFSF